MARILYGVNGEGFGHSTRSIEVIDFLIGQGHQVKVATFGKGYENLRHHFDMVEISGARFVYQENEVKYLKTAVKNLLQTPESLKSLNILDNIVNDFKPQLIISDFEPLTSAVANLKRIPLISFDNEHVLTKTKYDYPKNYKSEHQVAKLITRMMIFRAKAYLVLSFFPCRPLSRKVFILPPLIRSQVMNLKATDGDYIFVYLNNEFSGLLDILKQADAKFVVYGFDCDKQEGNLIFKKFDQIKSSEDLAASKAVIATAGFSLISEALFLGKPYLAMPAHKQFEQFLNGYHLAKLGYGEYYEKLTPEILNNFLDNLEKYKKNLNGGIKSGNQAVFAKLQELIKLYVD